MLLIQDSFRFWKKSAQLYSTASSDLTAVLIAGRADRKHSVL